MDLQEQLKKLFPDHVQSNNTTHDKETENNIWLQNEPIICKYEKRKGKPVTILEGYTGAANDFKTLAKEIKTKLSVGGSFKNDTIIIQGDYREAIMEILIKKGFQVKRVGG